MESKCDRRVRSTAEKALRRPIRITRGESESFVDKGRYGIGIQCAHVSLNLMSVVDRDAMNDTSIYLKAQMSINNA